MDLYFYLEKNWEIAILTLLAIFLLVIYPLYRLVQGQILKNKRKSFLNERKKKSVKDKLEKESEAEVKTLTQPGKPIQWLEVENKNANAQAPRELKSLKDLNHLHEKLTIKSPVLSSTKNNSQHKTIENNEEEMYNPSSIGNILVVDDALVVRKKISDLLKGLNYSVILKNDGFEAFTYLAQAIEQNKRLPDIIITDIEMPVMNGLQLIESIRKSTELSTISSIPLIVVSSHVELHMPLIESGNINGFISKPFKDEDLLGQIEYLLN